ncbi:AraC family transcriptional regulator [Ramlibacter solisilvae]|uniref:AraC family transcriptional regulator n=1 Tax=Ramlibacter tataouinensis TaxID=94132 RepID=A0A127JZX2_9BURK|nr:AraC family transcriptional regulator [Ramlibacter tataouinensis]AMO23692.1 AraC family transcriptional regulator [Ramlibacter tataouinensis]
MHSAVTISIALVHGLLSGVQARGRPVEPFLADAGIAPELLAQPGSRVTADQYAALFRSLIERLDDESLGFMSRPLKRGSFALLARSALTAGTLEVALRRIAHTLGLLQDDVMLEQVREGGLAGVSLRLIHPSVAAPIFFQEMLVRVIWRLAAWLVGGRLRIERFDFAFECPPHAASYGKIFPAPLRFGQPRSTFWFTVQRLQEPVRRDEESLRAFLLDSQAQIIVPRRDESRVSERLRRYLQHTQPAWPDLGAAAEALHMSSSTLQRRLASEGTSFQALRDQLRRDIAIVRLNTSKVPLAVLAEELGFADSANFQRAFKAWTGSAPGAYRRGGE